MFVGHYGVALAAKRFAPKTSAGVTFLAVQWLDIVWAILVLVGWEHARIVPGYLPASSLVFYDYPWSHSLLMAMGWSWLAFRLFKSPVLAVCVFSHWVLDWVAHAPDLPLFRGGPEVGLGLWHFRVATFVVESLLLLAGLWLYMRATRPLNGLGKLAMPAFTVLLLAVEAGDLWGPVPAKIQIVAISGEAAYLLFAGIAQAADTLRERLPEEPPIRLHLNVD
jgi:hypothetical protein